MKIIPRTIGITLVFAGLVLATGCAVRNGVLVFDPNAPIVTAPSVVLQSMHDNYEIQKLKQTAEQGDAIAQFTLGSCYANGRGIARDYTEAVKWYGRSAAQGYAEAQNRLGDCYSIGRGVAQDYAAAVDWYRKAAEQGNAFAQNNLGGCYSSGRGVAQDYAEAIEWYSKAANQGFMPAKINLQACENKVHGGDVTVSTQTTMPANQTVGKSNDPSAGNPLTIDEIKMLNQAGVKPDTIIGQIKSTNSRFSSQDIAAAQQANVDPAVIQCMQSH